jgi:hypothetical protein
VRLVRPICRQQEGPSSAAARLEHVPAAVEGYDKVFQFPGYATLTC